MAEGLGPTAANDSADIAATYEWVKLHTGAPGANGTANPASNTTRKQTQWTVTNNLLTNEDELLWSSVPASEDYSHFSTWSAESAGTFGWSGTLTANAVTTGDDFRLAAGELDGTVPVAS